MCNTKRKRNPRRRITGLGLEPGATVRVSKYQLACGHWVPADDKPIRFKKSRRACPECGGKAKRCAWTYDETHFAWDSSCGAKWVFMDGGPNENEIRFCYGCGKPVEIACEATPRESGTRGGTMKVYIVVAYSWEECEHMSAWASRDAAEREAARLRHLREKVKNIRWKHVHRMSDEAQIMRGMRRVIVQEMEVCNA